MFIKHSLHKRQKNRPLFSPKRTIFLEGEPAPKETTETLKPIDVFYCLDSYIDPVKHKVDIQKAKDVIKTLDYETKKRLHFLTPPIFSYTDAGQPQEYPDGYKVRINITDTPAKIKKALELAASRVLEPRFLGNVPQENNAAKVAMQNGLPFKNVRQAYFDDQNVTNKKINWNGQIGTPVPPYAYVEPGKKPWFNCAVETPAETAARLRKLEQERAAKERAERELAEQEEQKRIAQEKADKEATEEAIENEEATPEETKELDDTIAAITEKLKSVGDTCGIKLIAHTDYKKPYKAKMIATEVANLNKLFTELDRFKPVFDSLSENTQNILKLLTLVIDREMDTDPTIEGEDGNYFLWFNMRNSDTKIKRDLINRKNSFVKNSKFKKDTPIEAAERAAATSTFKNCREAYNSRPKQIIYDAASEGWACPGDRQWVSDTTYNYTTVEKPAPTPPPPPETPPTPPTHEPTPPPRRETPPPAPPRREPPAPPTPPAPPERPPESTEYVAAPSDVIKIDKETNKIVTKQKINGKDEIDEFNLKNTVANKQEMKRLPKGKDSIMALEFYKDTTKIGYIYLDRNGEMKCISESGFAIRYIKASKTVTIDVKKEVD